MLNRITIIAILFGACPVESFRITHKIPTIHPRGSKFKSIDMINPVSAVVAIPTLYTLMSVNEYITHRYYQHAEYNKNGLIQKIAKALNLPTKIRGGGHVEHHAETYDDMSLKTDEAWKKTPAAVSLDGDIYRGTAFTWEVTGLMTIQMIVTTVPIFRFILGIPISSTLLMLLPAMLLHVLIWNR